MYSFDQIQEFPIQVTFFTNQRTLFQEKFNSKTKFDDIFIALRKKTEYKSQVKPKSKYTLNGKEIRKNQTLEELILQNMDDPLSSELLIELDDLLYSGDAYSPLYKKILQPKLNPFGLYIYNPKEATLSLKDYDEKNIKLYELNDINEESACCNSNEELFISNNKNFWIINNNDFSIKKKNMLCNKANHSMICLNLKENEQWVFIVGGNDKKSFYYDSIKNYFINWGDTYEIHKNPALIQIGEYLYIFDNINTKRNYFERTKLINPTRKWEKIVVTIDKKIIPNFPSNFGVSYDSNGNILLLGGDNISSSNITYIYEPNKNSVILSHNGTNDKMLFGDKSFYKINNKYSVALPKNFEEKRVICLVDKTEQSLIKISTEIPKNMNNKIRIKSKIILDDKKIFSNNTEAELKIKAIEIKGKDKKFLMNNRLQFNRQNQAHQHQHQQFIYNNCMANSNFVCQSCHQNFSKMNNNNNNYNFNERNTNINSNKKQIKKYKNIENIHDEYYPTLGKKYGQNKNNNTRYKYKSKGYPQDKSVKVEIIYDEYEPIKVDYELGKPYVFKFKKPEKKEEPAKQIEDKNIIVENKEEINQKEEPLVNDNNVINDINPNLVKGFDDNREQELNQGNQEHDSLFAESDNKNLESQNIEKVENVDHIESEPKEQNEPEINQEQKNEEGEFIEMSKNPEMNQNENQEQNEKLAPYINEEENIEQENEEENVEQENEEENIEQENEEEAQYEEQYENQIEEKNEEYNEQIEEEPEHEQYHKEEENNLEQNQEHQEINLEQNQEHQEINLEQNQEHQEVNLEQNQEHQEINLEQNQEHHLEQNQEHQEINLEENQVHQENEVIKSNLEINNKEILPEMHEQEQNIEIKNEIINENDDNAFIKPVLKINYGINDDDYAKNEEDDINIMKGLKLNLDEHKVVDILRSDSLMISGQFSKQNKNEEKNLNIEISKEEDDNAFIKPFLKLDYGIEEEYVKEEEDLNLVKGLKLKLDEDKVPNIIQNDIFKLSREIQESKENEQNVINEVENQNQNGEKNEEIVENGNNEINNEVHNEENVEEEEHFEEMNYENGGEMEGEIHYEQGEEINFEEDGEEMHYEEEYENENGYEEHNHDENEHENEDENNQG